MYFNGTVIIKFKYCKYSPYAPIYMQYQAIKQALCALMCTRLLKLKRTDALRVKKIKHEIFGGILFYPMLVSGSND